MTIEEFIPLVAFMREAQREYFHTRSASVLQESKRLEKRVDEGLKELTANERQEELFS